MKTVPTQLAKKREVIPERALTGSEKITRGIAIVISIASVLIFCIKILFL